MMPWNLIASAFGWRAAHDGEGNSPVPVAVWHPRLRRRFAGPDAWQRATLLSVCAPPAQQIPLSQKEPRP